MITEKYNEAIHKSSISVFLKKKKKKNQLKKKKLQNK